MLLAATALSAPAAADVIVNNPTGESVLKSGFTQSESSVLVIGSTVLVAYDDSGSFTIVNDKFVGWSRSTNGGLSFTDMGSLPTNSGGDAGDPRFARSASTGTVFLTTIGFAVGNTQLFRSTDGGITFNTPVNATPGAVRNNDTHSVAVDDLAG
ncbi:MAG: exo-alpha-sialidase, partial [Alphaproteobacteria bacterium]|nr:exo-alpha-sialidase [Alphaproteobacteria bacterium]